MSDSTLDPNLVPSPGEVMARFRQEVLNDKNVDAIDEIAAEDFIELDPAPGQGAGREGLKEFLATVAFPAFPDQHWVTEEQITSGEKVVSRFTWYGTHQGTFMGIPATGRHAAVKASSSTGSSTANGRTAASSWTPSACSTNSAPYHQLRPPPRNTLLDVAHPSRDVEPIPDALHQHPPGAPDDDRLTDARRANRRTSTGTGAALRAVAGQLDDGMSRKTRPVPRPG
jgi:predicted ester cyclase